MTGLPNDSMSWGVPRRRIGTIREMANVRYHDAALILAVSKEDGEAMDLSVNGALLKLAHHARGRRIWRRHHSSARARRRCSQVDEMRLDEHAESYIQSREIDLSFFRELNVIFRFRHVLQ